MTEPLDQFRIINRATPAEMDALWAAGWRHFGTEFFRYASAWHGDEPVCVLPLRIDLQKFLPSRSQRRVLKRSAEVRVEFGPAKIDAEREQMFASHSSRFKDNRPNSLRDFLSCEPSRIPCAARECRLFLHDRLFAVGYFDVGQESVSAVYSMFDPTENRRSPGIKLILEEIHWATEHYFRYFYLGYCYDQTSFYDYKKNFAATEYLDWQTMRYLPFTPSDGGIAN